MDPFLNLLSSNRAQNHTDFSGTEITDNDHKIFRDHKICGSDSASKDNLHNKIYTTLKINKFNLLIQIEFQSFSVI